MDAKTLTALRQSIEKWERNAVAETPEDFTTGRSACALCGLFWGGGCEGCPVREATGRQSCYGSPYDDADMARDEWLDAPTDTALRDAAHIAARAEAEFLRSLLPEAGGQP